MAAASVFAALIRSASQNLDSCHFFVEKQENVYNETKEKTKSIYDFFMNELEDGKDDLDLIPELFIEEFDDEQIWQQLELLNEKKGKTNLAKLNEKLNGLETTGNVFSVEGAEDDAMTGVEETDNVVDDNDDDDNDDDDNDDDDDDEKEDEKEKESSLQRSKGILKTKESKQKALKVKTSVVDDQFFHLDDLSRFLDDEDKREEKRRNGEESGSEDGVDLFGEIESEEDDDEEDDDDDDDEKESDAEESAENAETESARNEIGAKETESARNVMYDAFFDEPGAEGGGHSAQSGKGQSGKSQSGKGQSGKGQSGEAKKEGKTKVSFKDEEGEGEEEEGEDDDANEGDEDMDLADVSDTETKDKKTEAKEGGKKLSLFGASDEEEEEETKGKSSNEKRKEKMKQRVKELEEANLAAKDWQMTGEIVADKRPENSLLEEHLQFDQTPKTGIMVTQNFMESLESLIKQRIKDKVFDDVERKVKPNDDPYEFKKRLVAEDEQKSKQSLAEVYEAEFLREQDKEEKENPLHAEIQKKMTSLFLQLDALSNFHFTPKPSAPEVTIISNLPTISLEEATPVTTAEAQTLAPEEISEKKKGLTIGKDERESTDKKRDLRKKKIRQREKQKLKEKNTRAAERANPGLGNKYSKEKMAEQLSKSLEGKGQRRDGIVKGKDSQTVKGSNSFFSNLQKQVDTKVKKKKKTNEGKKIKTLKL